MTSLLLHAALGALMVAVFFHTNASLYQRDWTGSRATVLVCVYYVVAITSVCIGLAAQERQVRWLARQQ